MKKLHYLLIASSLNIIIANISPNYAKNNAEYLCSNGSSTALCKAELNNDALTLTLKDGKRLTARRLGNWKQNNTGGGVERSCNVRIDLGNDFVYGLLKVNSKQGTSLIWPQRQINIRNLKDWKKWTVIIKRDYTPNCHSPFNFQKQDGEGCNPSLFMHENQSFPGLLVSLYPENTPIQRPMSIMISCNFCRYNWWWPEHNVGGAINKIPLDSSCHEAK